MRVFPNVVPFVFSLVATTIIKSGVYSIGVKTMRLIEFPFVVSIGRLIIRPGFNRMLDLIEVFDEVIKIEVIDVRKYIPCIR